MNKIIRSTSIFKTKYICNNLTNNNNVYNKNIKCFCKKEVPPFTGFKFNKKEDGKFQKMMKKYGKVGITTYISMYIGTGVIFYYLIKLRYIDPNKAVDNYERKGLNKYADLRATMAKCEPYTDLGLAFGINEIFEIVRLPLFIGFMTIYFKLKKK